MKSKTLILAILTALSSSAFALGTAFTYQGSLTDASLPASGAYDLQFTLQTQAGTPIGSPLLKDDVAVSAGLFSVELDFGAAISSADYQLVIGVRPGASSGSFTALSPATKLTPAPQAQIAAVAQLATSVSNGAIGSAQINTAQVQARVASSCPAGQSIRVVNGDGTVTCESSSSGPVGPVGPQGPVGLVGPVGPTGLTGSTGPVGPAGPIGLTGAAGSTGPAGANGAVGPVGPAGSANISGTVNRIPLFTGTTTAGNSAITQTGFGGSNFLNLDGSVMVNSLTTAGTTLTLSTGGFLGNAKARFTDAGTPTSFGDAPAVALGSSANVATAAGATVGGGGATRNAGVPSNFENKATANFSTVSGGTTNVASGAFSTVSGGNGNTASGQESTVTGGNINTASGVLSTASGSFNCAGGDYSWAGGFGASVRPGTDPGDGTCAPNSIDANGDNGTFMWADDQGGSFISTGPRQFLVRTAGGMAINTNTPTVGASLTVAPRLAAGTDSAISLTGSISGALVATSGDLLLQTTVSNKYIFTNDRFGVKRRPATNILEVEGDASKTTAGSWLANSDQRIKTDIQPITGALGIVNQLNPVTFQYTDAYRAEHADAIGTNQRYYNVIAQEFQKVFPDAVKGSGEYLPGLEKSPANEILQVDTYPALITSLSAIQELDVKLELDRAHMVKLESENVELKAQLSQQSAEFQARLNALEAKLQ